jgi:hypothetical protein
MTSHVNKYSTSKYKYVANENVNGFEYWSITLKDVTRKRYNTELEAAKAVDLILIRQGKEPVNILKRI